jgi:TetR/AcrR family transcriptional regulator, cholesterol catabolism regulator
VTTRAQMSAQTKKRLIAAATRLFAEKPYDDTSIGEIAAAAGVTKGAFYHHYDGKDAVLLALQHQILDSAIDESARVAALRLSPADELRSLIRLHLESVTEHKDVLSLTMPERRSMTPENWAVIRAKRDRIEAFVVDAVRRGQEVGDFRADGDARLLAYGLLGMCYWSERWLRRDGQWSVQKVAESFAQVALDGLRA